MPKGIRRIVLVGLMGSGKTTVGALLAKRLGWRFVDLDGVLERTFGRTVPEVFAEDGEGAFRSAEREAARRVLEGENLVLATGGGWAAGFGAMESLDSETASVWLRVSPEEAVRRVKASGVERPLLHGSGEGSSDGGGPLAAAGALARERLHRYALADLHVDTERSGPPEAVNAILRALALRQINRGKT